MSKFHEKFAKAAAGSLAPDEQVLAATRVMPRGGIKRAGKAAAFGGVVGTIIVNTKSTATAEGDLSFDTKPQMALAVTDRQLLVARVSAMSGGIKEILAAMPLSDVTGFRVEQGKAIGMKMLHLELAFSNGSTLYCEVPRVMVGEGKNFAEALASRVPALPPQAAAS